MTIDDTADVVIIIATLGPGRVGCYIYMFISIPLFLMSCHITIIVVLCRVECFDDVGQDRNANSLI